MREILFKGKRVDNGEWVYGGYYTDGKKHFIITTVKHMPDTRDWDTAEYYEKNPIYLPDFKEVIPETIGQFTGLTDKNGKKIFEGDIHQFQDLLFVVEFGAFYDCENDIDLYGFYLRNINYRNRTYLFDGNESEYFNIFGNIHDNPELLGGSNNG